MALLKKLDKYIIVKFLGTFFFTVLLFAAVAVVIDFSERIDEFIEKSAPTKAIIFDYYLNFIPHIVFLLSPLFIFIAAIFFTSRLAYRSEIVAMLAGGISFYRLLLGPYLISATILVLIQLLGNHYFIPNSNKTRIAFENEYIKSKYINRDRNIHLQISPDTFIYMESYNNTDSTGRRFTIEKLQGMQLQEKLSARRIEWQSESKKWKIKNWSKRTIQGLDEALTMGQETDTTFNFTPNDFERRVRFSEAMTTPELTQYIEREKKRGTPLLEFYEVEYHRRTATPMATFVLTIIALSIASRKVRGGVGFHLFLGILIAATYFMALQFSTTFATKASLAPLLAVWIPNIIFGVLAIILMIRAPK